MIFSIELEEVYIESLVAQVARVTKIYKSDLQPLVDSIASRHSHLTMATIRRISNEEASKIAEAMKSVPGYSALRSVVDMDECDDITRCQIGCHRMDDESDEGEATDLALKRDFWRSSGLYGCFSEKEINSSANGGCTRCSFLLPMLSSCFSHVEREDYEFFVGVGSELSMRKAAKKTPTQPSETDIESVQLYEVC